MKWNLWRGMWNRWFSQDPQLQKWFQDLDAFLSRAFQRRISLRDNIFCSFLEQSNVTANTDITVQNALTNLVVEGAVVLQSSEPVQLTWSASGFDFTYKLTSSAGTVESVKIAIFYREE